MNNSTFGKLLKNDNEYLSLILIILFIHFLIFIFLPYIVTKLCNNDKPSKKIFKRQDQVNKIINKREDSPYLSNKKNKVNQKESNYLNN